MSRRFVGLTFVILLGCLAGAAVHGGGYGFDVVLPPARHAEHLAEVRIDGRSGSWMRIRGVVDDHRVKRDDTRTIETDRAGLLALRERGVRTAVFLRWSGDSWPSGPRPGWGHRMPLDLREAYERAKWLGATYGDLVDAWEIDNEPDIDFGPDNPETYVAFLKAVYLGLKAGMQMRPEGGQMKPEGGNLKPEGGDLKPEGGDLRPEGGNLKPEGGDLKPEGGQMRPEGGNLKPEGTKRKPEGGRRREPEMATRDPEAVAERVTDGGGSWLARKRGLMLSGHSGFRLQTSGFISHPRVIMAPLALPPGPFLERLWANGIASYTDGFNFHYYGFAEDFTGVYRQFQDAVTRLSAEAELKRLEGGDLRPEGGAHGIHGTHGRRNLRAETGLRSPQRGSAWELQASGFIPQASGSRAKGWPVFITEYGYGLLDADARNTTEGRVRQWAWFADVVKQVRTLRIEAPMAFLWNPYYEADLNEFGLTTKMPASVVAEGLTAKGAEGREDDRSEVAMRDEPKHRDGQAEGGPQKAQKGTKAGAANGEAVGRKEAQKAQGGAGISELALGATGEAEGMRFSPADFGTARVEPWMERIGQRVGDWYASPALAYLWDYAERHPYRPRAWSVRAAPASSVVIDFLAGQNMAQAKSSGGYVLGGAPVEWAARPVRTGGGHWVIYNFGAEPVVGRFEIEGPSPIRGSWDGALTLAPGERREVPVELEVSGERWVAHALRARFVSESEAIAPAVFSTRLYPATSAMADTPVADFSFPADAGQHAAVESRAVATGESRLHRVGRWWMTEGVRVEETAEGVWRFHIDYLPAEPLRPAIVELPLPKGFSFACGTLLALERRRVAADKDAVSHGVTARGAKAHKVAERMGAMAAGVSAPSADQLKPRAGRGGDMMDVYFRTENGNLYQTWPRLPVPAEWTWYLESVENFTMSFFGRAALPWRFAENTPVALVFFLRPSQLPSVFEVRNAEIIRLGVE